MTPGVPLGRGLGTYLGALGKIPRFGIDFGASWAPRGPPWGTLVGAIFALGPSPGCPQGARGTNFEPSWASPLLDADSGPPKSQKKLNFEGARTLKIELAPRRECNFHVFTSVLPEP